MGDDANAMEGWDYAEMIQHAGKAKNDVMGAFFFFLRDILLRFCNKVQDVDIHFYAFNMDALQIPNYLSQGKADSTFDRIEVGVPSSILLSAVGLVRRYIDRLLGIEHLRSRLPRARGCSLDFHSSPEIQV